MRLSESPKINVPWQAVAVDWQAPFPAGNREYKHLAVFMDLLSRYLMCTPIKNKSAAAVEETLEIFVIMKYGCMEKLIQTTDANSKTSQ